MSWRCSAGSYLTAPRMMNTAFVATLCPGGWRLCRCGVHQVWDQDALQESGGAGVLIPSECRLCFWRSFDCGAAMRAPNRIDIFELRCREPSEALGAVEEVDFWDRFGHDLGWRHYPNRVAIIFVIKNMNLMLTGNQSSSDRFASSSTHCISQTLV